MSELDQPTPKGISRRTVAKAMAWSVPVVAVAAAVPAYAASGSPPVITPGTACKSPGNSCETFNKGYRVPVTIQNPDPTKTIWITGVTIGSVGDCTNLTTAQSLPATPFSVAPNTSINVLFQANASNSANQSCTFSFSVTWGHASSGTIHTRRSPCRSSFRALRRTAPASQGRSGHECRVDRPGIHALWRASACCTSIEAVRADHSRTTACGPLPPCGAARDGLRRRGPTSRRRQSR